MRDLQECKAEVLRRSEQRIRRWRVGRAVAACCIPLALCVTVLVASGLLGRDPATDGAWVGVYDEATVRITDPAKAEQVAARLEELFATAGSTNSTDGSLGDLGNIPPAGSLKGEPKTYTILIAPPDGGREWYTLTGNELRDQKSHVTVELTDSQLASLKTLLGLS